MQKFSAKVELSAVIPGLLFGILFLALGIYMALSGFLEKGTQGIIIAIAFIVVSILAIAGTLLLFKLSYYVTNEGIIAAKSFLDRRLFPFSDIADVRKIESSEVEQIYQDNLNRQEAARVSVAPGFVGSWPKKGDQLVGGMYEFKNTQVELIDLLRYSGGRITARGRQASQSVIRVPFGVPVYAKYSPLKDIKASARGNFVLLETKEPHKRFLLTPSQPELFVNAVKGSMESKR